MAANLRWPCSANALASVKWRVLAARFWPTTSFDRPAVWRNFRPGNQTKFKTRGIAILSARLRADCPRTSPFQQSACKMPTRNLQTRLSTIQIRIRPLRNWHRTYPGIAAISNRVIKTTFRAANRTPARDPDPRRFSRRCSQRQQRQSRWSPCKEILLQTRTYPKIRNWNQTKLKRRIWTELNQTLTKLGRW